MTSRRRVVDVLTGVSDLLLLLAGFVLTTVAGGLLGYWLQNRTWKHQERSRIRQAELEAARDFYEELSRLLDRRLHRMRQLDWRLDRPGLRGEVDEQLSRYREILDDWNGILNRNLALAMSYLGPNARLELEALYKSFEVAGTRLESVSVSTRKPVSRRHRPHERISMGWMAGSTT